MLLQERYEPIPFLEDPIVVEVIYFLLFALIAIFFFSCIQGI